jgi:16S rRNA (guanine(966)-N(2))-methyltransferase RsmD
LRESLFSILAPRIEGTVFLDAYAGAGTVGIEALSRGAERAIFIERNRAACEVLLENLRSLGVMARAEVVRASVNLVLERFKPNIVFLDPPYKLEKEYATSLGILGAAPPPLVIAQHASRFALEERYGELARFRVVRQGDNSLSFYSPAEATGE